jgi:hypothetical protein
MRFRNFASAFFIVAYGIAMAIFGYLGRANFVDGQSLVFMTLFLATIAVVVSWAIWNLDIQRRREEKLGYQFEKRKREQIDTVLRDLSHEDLLILKRRLIDAEVDEIVDEGELTNGAYKR